MGTSNAFSGIGTALAKSIVNSNAVEFKTPFEKKCESCKGEGIFPSIGVCGTCNGSGFEPTELGDAILDLISHNLENILKNNG